MDFIQIILGQFLLEFLGALIRYVYLNMGSLIKKDDYIPFAKVWCPKGSIDRKSGNSELNHMIGVIFFVIIVVLLVIFLS
jgi:hypothetical protein